MVRVIFIVGDEEYPVQAAGEATLMELAVRNNIHGIVGEYGVLERREITLCAETRR